MLTNFFSGLKNNALPETFGLRHTVGNNKFPVKYIKIMPLQVMILFFIKKQWNIEDLL